MDGARIYSPTIDTSVVYLDDDHAKVNAYYDRNEIVIMQPQYLGGKIVVSMDEYDRFEGNIRDFVLHKRRQALDDPDWDRDNRRALEAAREHYVRRAMAKIGMRMMGPKDGWTRTWLSTGSYTTVVHAAHECRHYETGNGMTYFCGAPKSGVRNGRDYCAEHLDA